MSDRDYPDWVYLMAKRLEEKIPDIDDVNYFPYYNKDSKFMGWLFRIVRGDRYVSLVLDELPGTMDSPTQERVFDFHIEGVLKTLEGASDCDS